MRYHIRLHNEPHNVNKVVFKFSGDYAVSCTVSSAYYTVQRYCFSIAFVCACLYMWIQVCREAQACVFHSVAKLNYPQRCAFLSEKLCITRQASKGRLGGWMQRQRQTACREEGETERERGWGGGVWL